MIGKRPAAGRRLGRTWGQRAILAFNLVLIAASLGSAALLDYGYGRAASIKETPAIFSESISSEILDSSNLDR